MWEFARIGFAFVRSLPNLYLLKRHNMWMHTFSANEGCQNPHIHGFADLRFAICNLQFAICADSRICDYDFLTWACEYDTEGNVSARIPGYNQFETAHLRKPAVVSLWQLRAYKYTDYRTIHVVPSS